MTNMQLKDLTFQELCDARESLRESMIEIEIELELRARKGDVE